MEAALLMVWLCAGLAASSGRSARWLAAPASFALETTVLVNDVARTDRELGYKLRARLDVRPLHGDDDGLLLRFQLVAPKLHLRGKHRNAEYLPHPSPWDEVGPTPFFAQWARGAIVAAYLDPRDHGDVLNYKKSIVSLFQFNSMDGEYNETDISGDCSVLYETLSDTVFRKFKKRCSGDAAPATVRRVWRYTGAAGGLSAVHAEELLEVGDAALGLKARSWHALTALGDGAPAPSGDYASLEAALAELPASVTPVRLPLVPPATEPDFADDTDYEAALEAQRAQLEREAEGAGAGGDAAAAELALRLAPALRRAPQAALQGLLHAPANHAILEGLVRALGLAGTRAALAAVDALLQLRAPDAPRALATVYLEAFALGDRPEAAAAAELLRLGEEAAAPELRASALLAAAAAAHTLARSGRPQPAQQARDTLLRALARCKDEPCAATRLRALANLRRADTVDALLEHAQRAHAAPAAALAALDALDALAAAPSATLSYAHAQRLAHVALDERAPLEVRAAALQLALGVLTRLPNAVARLARALHEARAPPELRRVFWQRLRALGERDAAVRALLPRLHPQLRGWDALALPGTSSVLEREPGWAGGGWRAALDSAQVAQGGLLRRGLVRLLARSPTNRTADLVSVEMWTRGMEAFAGGGAGGDAAAETGGEPASAGLAFAVGGVRTRGVALFSGQAELLAHVWAGAGSAPTPALRAVVPLEARAAWLPLGAGVALRAEWSAAAAVAVDAHAHVSLWWRTARAALQLRVAAVAQARLALDVAWGRVRAEARSALEPRMRIAADLDFYDAVALCVRVHAADHAAARNVSLHSRLGARALRVARRGEWRQARAGRTLALGAPNDAACRTLRAADDDDDGQ